MFGLRKSDLEYIIEFLKSQQEVEEAVIYGSRAKGNFRNGSDVDIALMGKSVSRSNVLQTSFALNEESAMPYKFDVLDFNTIENNNLRDHILRAGKLFYSKKDFLKVK